MILGFSFLGILKIFVLLGLAIYIIFALVVVKQVQIMAETVKIGFDKPIKIVSYIHLAFSVLVFLFALISL